MSLYALRIPAFHIQQHVQSIANAGQFMSGLQNAIRRSDLLQIRGDRGFLRRNFSMLA